MSQDWANFLDFPSSPPNIWQVSLAIEFDALVAALSTAIEQHNYAIINYMIDQHSIPGIIRYILVDVLDAPLGEIRVRRAATNGSILEVLAPPKPEPRNLTAQEQAEIDAQQDINSRYWMQRKNWGVREVEQNMKHGQLQILQRGFVKSTMNRLITDLSRETISIRSNTADPPPSNKINISKLRKTLSGLFNEHELKMLCDDLEIDYDDIGGDEKTAKIYELIKYLQRRNRISDLLNVVKQERPNTDWEKEIF